MSATKASRYPDAQNQIYTDINIYILISGRNVLPSRMSYELFKQSIIDKIYAPANALT